MRPLDALDAVDGWAGDQYTSYRLPNGTVCTDINFRGANDSATAGMLVALGKWQASLPDGQTTVTEKGLELAVQRVLDFKTRSKIVVLLTDGDSNVHDIDEDTAIDDAVTSVETVSTAHAQRWTARVIAYTWPAADPSRASSPPANDTASGRPSRRSSGEWQYSPISTAVDVRAGADPGG